MDPSRCGEVTDVDGLSEPLPRHTDVLLRRAVLEHAAAERRRVYPPVLHVGVPGERVASLAVGTAEPTDPGLRTDVVAALRVRAGVGTDQLAWLTRSGGLELQDVDARWLAATLRGVRRGPCAAGVRRRQPPRLARPAQRAVPDLGPAAALERA